MSDPTPPSEGTKNVKNALEWAVFAVSCLLVLATLGVLLWDVTKAGKTPPLLSAQPGQPYLENGRVWIPVEVTNTGGEPAAAVEIEAIRPSPAGGDKAGFTIEHLPRGATRTGHVSFPGADTNIGVDIQISSHQKP